MYIYIRFIDVFSFNSHYVKILMPRLICPAKILMRSSMLFQYRLLLSSKHKSKRLFTIHLNIVTITS